MIFNTISVKTKITSATASTAFVDIMAWSNGGFALDTTGQAWGWGNGASGALGNSTTLNRSTPTAVCGGHVFSSLSPGHGSDTTGKSWTWGRNENGDLGNNTGGATWSVLTPVAVCGGLIFTKIAASQATNRKAGITNTGSLYTWGPGIHGALGNGSTANRSTPVLVAGGIVFSEISIGTDHMVGLDQNGKAWSWGRNFFGQLGQSSNILSIATPTAVVGNKTFTQVSCVGANSYALDIFGSAWSWGSNDSGRCGDNTIINRSSPVAVCGNKTFTRISGSIAIDTTGQAWAWGPNSAGNCGDNTRINRSSPVAVCGNITFTRVSTGLASYGLDTNGVAYSWGNNTLNALGDGSLVADRITPATICQPF